MGASYASDNMTDHCTIGSDENALDVEAEPEKTIADISDEINNAGENETVHLEDTYSLKDASNELNITKSLTIVGEATVSGQNNNLDINVKNSYVRINDITFKDINNFNFNTASGSAVLTNCTFENINSFNAHSAKISLFDCRFIASGVTLAKVENSRFTDSVINSASQIENCDIRNSLINVRSTEIRIINSTIADNTRFDNTSYDMTIVNSTFTNNTQTLTQNERKLNISNSSFIANTVSGDFFSFENAQASIVKSRFINNTCDDYLLNFGEESSNVYVCENVFLSNTANGLLSWSYSKFNKYYIKMELIKISSFFEFSKNILIDNFNENSTYSQIHIEPEIDSTALSDYYASSINIRDNFFGFNMDSAIELDLIPIIDFVSPINNWENLIGWVNVYLNYNDDGDYYLEFTNQSGDAVEMPDTVFSVQDKNTGKIIQDNVKVNETFYLDSGNVYILNEGLSIVNKPPAEIEVVFKSFDYDNIHILVYLKTSEGDAISYQNMAFKTSAYFSGGGLSSDTFIKATGFQGFATAYKTGTDYDTLRYLEFTPAYFNFVASFASMDYSLTQATYTKMKLSKVNCTVSASDAATRYKVSKKIKITLKNTNTKENIKECYITVLIYKSSKKVSSEECMVKDGVVYYSMPQLDAGTYSIRIKSSDPHYTFEMKTVKFTVKRAVTKTSALKVKAKYKKTKYFKIKVTRSGTPVKYVKVKVKVYTGKKYVTKILKTSKYGIAKLNTKYIKPGYHKVTITSYNKNYYISKKSSIRIYKSRM